MTDADGMPAASTFPPPGRQLLVVGTLQVEEAYVSRGELRRPLVSCCLLPPSSCLMTPVSESRPDLVRFVWSRILEWSIPSRLGDRFLLPVFLL